MTVDVVEVNVLLFELGRPASAVADDLSFEALFLQGGDNICSSDGVRSQSEPDENDIWLMSSDKLTRPFD